MSKDIKATIFIPTFNGEKYIGSILKSIASQRYEQGFEVLIIDSGSSDKTLKIIKRYANKFKNIRIHQIPNSEFGHGKTRNLAAQMAHGEYIVYLSHDAIPADKYWLYELLKPLDMSPQVAGVIGRQIPRKNCPPMLKYEITHLFDKLGPNHATTFYYNDFFARSHSIKSALTYYSDVNSATRRDFIVNEIPYRDVKYAEDQLFGRDIIKSGYIKAYAPRGSVIHSNDLRLREYKKRIFDETLALRKIGLLNKRHVNKLQLAKSFIKGALGDTIRITRDADYSLTQKIHLVMINPLFRAEKLRGIILAMKVSLDDEDLHDKYSLESSRKDKAI